ncbi:rnhA, partial [Mucuna pruriens]
MKATGSPKAEVGGRWLLSVDGASNQARSGAGVILESSNGVLIEQLLHFEFKTSNNQVEYEALLVGMRLAKELEAKVLIAKSDSKLMTVQVNGEYQARDPQLVKYLDRTTKLAAAFEKFTLHHVPRE